MTRPIFQWTATELFALANKLEVQGLFAAIDIQDSMGESNESKVGILNDIVADSVRFVAETKEQAEKLVVELQAQQLDAK